MPKKKTRSWNLREFETFRRALQTLEEARDQRAVMNKGDTVEVEYDAIRDVVEWCDDAMSDFEALVKIRDIIKLTKCGSG